MARSYRHWEKLEKNALLLGVLIAVAVSLGGLAEIIPLFNDAQTVQPAPGVKPYEPLRLAVGNEMLFVTPGIRPVGAAHGDQKRVATPTQAIDAGADYLVVGRPITAAADPKAVSEAVVAEIAAAAQ